MSREDEQGIDWQAALEADGLILADDGSVRFTGRHKKEMASYFEMAGINIDDIKTKDEYVAARKAASPYFEEWLQSVIARRGVGRNLERDLLIAVLAGDQESARKLRMRIDSKAINQDPEGKKNPRRGGDGPSQT